MLPYTGVMTNEVMSADVLCWDVHRNSIDMLEERDCPETKVMYLSWTAKNAPTYSLPL